MLRTFQSPYDFPTLNGEDGDSLLWASLLHASGENHLEGILACQSGDGRFWRSPSLKDKSQKNPFSKDMATGLILAATIDSIFYENSPILQALEKWLKYVRNNNYQAFPSKKGKGIMTPAVFWASSYAGANVPYLFKVTRGLLYPYLFLAAKVNKPGYTLHLVGVSLFALQVKYGNWFTKKIAQILVKRQSKNPFFQYLAGNYDLATELTYNYYVNALYNQQGSRQQWAWQRDDEENAWKDSCGHDFIFMNNILKRTL